MRWRPLERHKQDRFDKEADPKELPWSLAGPTAKPQKRRLTGSKNRCLIIRSYEHALSICRRGSKGLRSDLTGYLSAISVHSKTSEVGTLPSQLKPSCTICMEDHLMSCPGVQRHRKSASFDYGPCFQHKYGKHQRTRAPCWGRTNATEYNQIIRMVW